MTQKRPIGGWKTGGTNREALITRTSITELNGAKPTPSNLNLAFSLKTGMKGIILVAILVTTRKRVCR